MASNAPSAALPGALDRHRATRPYRDDGGGGGNAESPPGGCACGGGGGKGEADDEGEGEGCAGGGSEAAAVGAAIVLAAVWLLRRGLTGLVGFDGCEACITTRTGFGTRVGGGFSQNEWSGCGRL